MTCAVYMLKSPSGKFYIGSSINAEKRTRAHRNEALRGANSPKLNNAYARHGDLSASFLIICRPEDRLMYEQACIDALKPEYNCAQFVNATDPTPEHKAKIGAAHKGKVLSEETKAKIRAKALGRRHSAEARQKMSVARKGKSPSEKHRASLSLALKGKCHHSEAQREKRRLQGGPTKGMRHSAETRARMSQIHMGKPGTTTGRRRPPEEVAAISAWMKEAHARVKAAGLPWRGRTQANGS